MNDIIPQNMRQDIVNALLMGENPDTIIKNFSCKAEDVLMIMGSGEFLEIVQDYLEKDIKISGLMALQNIKKIAQDDEGSKATRLKANQWLAEKALEVNKLGNTGDSPATMTQDQLARRLKELQAEAIKRAKPIDTGVIEQNLSYMLD